jgi:hypothetical protein
MLLHYSAARYRYEREASKARRCRCRSRRRPCSAARVARPGQGRSGGYRTIIVWRIRQRCIFVHGFAKSGKADLTPDELEVYRKLAALLLGYDDKDHREGLG